MVLQVRSSFPPPLVPGPLVNRIFKVIFEKALGQIPHYGINEGRTVPIPKACQDAQNLRQKQYMFFFLKPLTLEYYLPFIQKWTYTFLQNYQGVAFPKNFNEHGELLPACLLSSFFECLKLIRISAQRKDLTSASAGWLGLALCWLHFLTYWLCYFFFLFSAKNLGMIIISYLIFFSFLPCISGPHYIFI